jgi:hypothetical protein
VFDGANVKRVLAPKRELVDDPSKGSAGRANVVERGFREGGWIESDELGLPWAKGRDDERYDLDENLGGLLEDERRDRINH